MVYVVISSSKGGTEKEVSLWKNKDRAELKKLYEEKAWDYEVQLHAVDELYGAVEQEDDINMLVETIEDIVQEEDTDFYYSRINWGDFIDEDKRLEEACDKMFKKVLTK